MLCSVIQRMGSFIEPWFASVAPWLPHWDLDVDSVKLLYNNVFFNNNQNYIDFSVNQIQNPNSSYETV